MKTQHSTWVMISGPWWFLHYCVVLCFRINGNKFCPCSLVLRQSCCKHVKELIFESLSRPIWGEKRCKIITDFDTGQIFSELFSLGVINNFSKIRINKLCNNILSHKKFFKKICSKTQLSQKSPSRGGKNIWNRQLKRRLSDVNR